MRKTFLMLGLLLSVLLLYVMPGGACGDKLVSIGRGVRYQRAYLAAHPAAILFYTSAVSATYDQLESTLKQGGHKIRRVGSRQELDEALDGGRYDIVLADLDDATTLEQPARSYPKIVLLPIIFNGTKSEAARAEAHFGCVLKVPGKAIQYLSAIDKATELKLKRERSKISART